MTILRGWRYSLFIAAIVGGGLFYRNDLYTVSLSQNKVKMKDLTRIRITATCYPIIIAPMIDPEYYKNIQKKTRAGINQELIQPGNMKVWTDPFDRKKKEE